MVEWREAGQGQAVTLLHGIGSGAAVWHKQLASARSYRLLAWEMPGYGASTPLATATPDAGEYAGQLARMLDAAGAEQTLLVGHSLGALIASAFAARYPQRVAGLVLASPAQGYGSADPATRRQIWQSRQRQVAQGTQQMAVQRAHHLLSQAAGAEDIATVAAEMGRLQARGYLAAAWMLAHDDIDRWLEGWGGGFEVWCGDEDSITPPARCRALAERWAMPYYALPGAGHACYLDQASVFNQLLNRFIREASHERTN